MSKNNYQRGNIRTLGSNRAESDKDLKLVFVETGDYRTMAQSLTYNAVVGRRGAGKSALFLMLSTAFKSTPNTILVQVGPNSSGFKGLVAAVSERLGDDADYQHARELTRHAWQAVFFHHVLANFGATHPAWLCKDPIDSAVAFLESLTDTTFNKAVYTAGRTSRDARERCTEALLENQRRGVVLVDGIDDGWLPEPIANGIIGGLAAAAADFQDQESGVRLVLFIRDNMYRILGDLDVDFSRILAGDSLRLDWNHESLLELVALRLKHVFALDIERPIEIWNRFAKKELSGKEGFNALLKRTLYRPRDVLELLNAALQSSQRGGRDRLVEGDIEQAAKEISDSRLRDLKTEYSAVLPGLADILGQFSGQRAVLTLSEMDDWLEEVRVSRDATTTIAKLGSSRGVVRALYGIGFLGFEQTSGGFVFCHDGNSAPEDDLSWGKPDFKIAVHPCYHRALSIVEGDDQPLDVLLSAPFEYGETKPNTAAISELIKEHGKALLKQLGNISEGADQSGDFEKWVHAVICLVFAQDLKNVQLKANMGSPSRRDIIASNEANDGPWKRILLSHKANQVLFEVKNYPRLTPSDYQQVASYTGGDYGEIGFLVYRGQGPNPNRNERAHLQDQKQRGRTLILLPVSLVQRLLKKQTHKDVKEKFGDWYDKHLRAWSSPLSGKHPK